MKIVYLQHPHQIKRNSVLPSVMALGFFDGVHIGHQSVIHAAKSTASQRGLASAVMTFYPHPAVVLGHKPDNQTITPLDLKINVIEKLGIDTMYIVNFTKEFSQLSPQKFIEEYIIGLSVKHVVAGFDYTYGRFGKGTMETIERDARGEFTFTKVDKVERNNIKISSTLIRQLIHEGKVERIPNLLGRYYQTEGRILIRENGDFLIGPSERFMLPKEGVYSVCVKINNVSLNGISVIFNQSSNNGQVPEPLVGFHLFDSVQDIQEEHVILEWRKCLSEETSDHHSLLKLNRSLKKTVLVE